jgi:hypothetical protein
VRHPEQLPVGGHGDGAGKLLSDPGVWYPAVAKLDGVDIDSDSPIDRFYLHVHQRRQVVHAAEVKAHLCAALGDPESTKKAAAFYFELSMPVSEDSLRVAAAAERLKREQVDALMNQSFQLVL